MRAIFLILAALLVVACAANEKKIVCYYGSWAIYKNGNGKAKVSDIDPTLCTHLIYTFIGIRANAELDLIDEWAHLPSGLNGFALFNKLREKSPSTKTLIAVGGWNQGSSQYSTVVGDPSLRKTLVNNLVDFVKKYQFDGLDFDWEYPNQRGGKSSDRKNYVLLLKELRERFDEEGLLLTAAVAGAEQSASLSYLIPEVSKYLDFINVMSYDLHGSWDKKTGINAPLYPGSWEKGSESKLNVDACINYWISKGAPREKLVLGIPFYGRTFTLDDPKKNGIPAPASQPGKQGPYSGQKGHLNYNEFCELNLTENWQIHFQEEQRVSYAVKGNQWVGFDDVRSIKEKAEYVNKHKLGGAMIWSVDSDDFRGICGEKYPLLKTLNRVLRNGVPLPSTPSSSTTSKSPKSSTPRGSSSASTSKTTTSSPKSTTQAAGGGKICTAEGYARDPLDCSIFYYCEPDGNGDFIETIYRCPNKLYFDLTISVCNWPYLVKC